MKITHRFKVGLRVQNLVFVVLLLAVAGALAFLSTRYVWQADWTAGGRNSLTDASRKLLKTLDGPVEITAFARDEQALRQAIRELIARYQRADAHIKLTFVNPDTQPQRVRDLGITADGELYIQYRGRSDKVTQLNEAAITNALLSIARASGSQIVFLTGHGERKPKGRANFDLGDFDQALQRKGFRISTLNLASSPKIPANTAVLVIASPQTNFLPGEVKLIEAYVARGGNLLWLGDPGPRHGLEPLAKALDIHFLDGTIVDATSPLFGVHDIRWLVLDHYPPSDITQGFNLETLLPEATAIQTGPDEKWRVKPFLQSRALPRSWLEAGKLAGEVQFNKESRDKAGPLDIGVTLARPLAGLENGVREKTGQDSNAATTDKADDKPQGDQRVVVVGDGDFLANAYLNNGGNVDLGLNIFNWLSHNDRYIDVNVPRAPDLHLALSSLGQILLSAGFLIALPLLLLIYGGFVWFRRRRR